VLFVSSVSERRNSLARCAGRLGLEVLSAARCRDARSVLRSRTGIEVVVVDVTLPDGNWCEVLRWMVEQRLDARVILVSPVSDAALWSEAVWRGAYDVLIEPFHSWEFSRSVEGALRNRPHRGDAAPGASRAGNSFRPGHRAKEKQKAAAGLIAPDILPGASPA
jgi:DNA-binding NtrC family response regulator